MPRECLWVVALASLLLACATTQAPTSQQQPPPLVSPDEQPSAVQHPDAPSRKRGVILPSDVSRPGSEPPAMTETASPGAAPATGGGN
jgi:hypothetical protein